MILSNFDRGDWQGGQDMTPVVADLCVTVEDWQVSSCQQSICCLGKIWSTSIHLASVFCFLGCPLLPSFGPSLEKDVGYCLPS